MSDSQRPTEPARITAEAFEELVLRRHRRESFCCHVEDLASGFARLRLRFHPAQLRSGGTIAGPVMFTLADTALYAAVLSAAGLVQQAVTTDLSIRFLERPGPNDLTAEGRLLKRRGRLMVGEVTIWSAGHREPVAHAAGTYAVPRSSRRETP